MAWRTSITSLSRRAGHKLPRWAGGCGAGCFACKVVALRVKLVALRVELVAFACSKVVALICFAGRLLFYGCRTRQPLQWQLSA